MGSRFTKNRAVYICCADRIDTQQPIDGYTVRLKPQKPLSLLGELLMNSPHRRQFLATSAAASASLALAGSALAKTPKKPKKNADSESLFDISLAQWSLHRRLRGGGMDNLDFAKVTKEEFGIGAIEYVNQFFQDKAKDEKYLGEMMKRADDHGVKSLIIMIDREGNLGDADDAKRKKAVENHHKWVDAAKFMGCHSIRVNAASGGTYSEQVDRAADGLSSLF